MTPTDLAQAKAEPHTTTGATQAMTLHISVIIPCHNEAGNVRSLAHAYTVAGAREILFLDDGSTDGTWAEMLRVTGGPVRALGSGRIDPWDYPDHLLQTLCENCHGHRQELTDKAVDALRIAVKDYETPRLESACVRIIGVAMEEMP